LSGDRRSEAGLATWLVGLGSWVFGILWFWGDAEGVVVGRGKGGSVWKCELDDAWCEFSRICGVVCVCGVESSS